jgi:hypothetical protein
MMGQSFLQHTELFSKTLTRTVDQLAVVVGNPLYRTLPLEMVDRYPR